MGRQEKSFTNADQIIREVRSGRTGPWNIVMNGEAAFSLMKKVKAHRLPNYHPEYHVTARGKIAYFISGGRLPVNHRLTLEHYIHENSEEE